MEARAEVTISAENDAVWRAICVPEAMAGWLADRIDAPSGVVQGAVLTLCWDSLGVSLPVQVKAIEPGSRLVFVATLGGREHIHDIGVRSAGGDTRVEMVHAGFAKTERGRDERAGQKAGWHASLRMLKRYVEVHAPAQRHAAAVATTWVTSFDSIETAMFSADGLGRWLCPGGAVLGAQESTRASLQLADGLALDGEILAWAPPHELVIATDGLILRLRAISQDGHAGLGAKLILAQLSAFSDTAREHQDRIRDAMATAFAQLQGNASG